jgi:S1-C subfamily serine protease
MAKAVPYGSVAAALVVAAGLTAGCTSSPSSPAAGASPVSPSAESAAVGVQDAYEQVVAIALPSLVRIDSTAGLGSGIVLDTAGDIITNAHVVGPATTFTVTLSSGNQQLPAKLVSSFPQGDLAVIKLDSAPAGLSPATFADSSKLRVGQTVLAMGNPLGLTSSVTQGIISATGRTVTEPATQTSPGATLTDMVQTSAAINPGNSGGALVDLSGQVVGIPTLAAVDQNLGGAAPGIGFAIASNTVTNISGQILKNGKVTNSGLASLDATVRTATDSTGKPVGVSVIAVSPGGPAQKAGIAAGDTITAVNGTATPSTTVLAQTLAGLRPGQQVPVMVTHADGSTATVTVTLGTLPVS